MIAHDPDLIVSPARVKPRKPAEHRTSLGLAASRPLDPAHGEATVMTQRLLGAALLILVGGLLAALLTPGLAWADGLADANTGLDALRRGDHDLAIHYLTRAIQSGELSTENLPIALNHRGNAYAGKGAHDRAIQDYDAALRLKPDDAGALFGRGRARFHQGQFAAAIPDLSEADRLQPQEKFRAIWVYLTEARAGRDGVAGLTRRAERWTLTEWPGPVVAMFVGRLAPTAVLEAARHADPKKEREQLCEAYFYVGQHRLLAGDRVGAVRLFRAALATGVTAFIEYAGAQAELRQLGE